MSDAVQKFEDGLARVAAGFETTFAQCPDESSLRAAAAKLIGGSGEVTQLLKLMPQLPGDRRKELGQRANALKNAVQSAFDARLEGLARAARQADLEAPPIDPSLPGRGLSRGALHPITRTIDALLDVFSSIGFEVTDAPEIELADFNFTRLGFPPDHPATDMQDSFFVAGGELGARGVTRFEDQVLLRTHTSNAQVHEMSRRRTIPIACISAGKVFRRDDDATHSPMFHQIEGFWVDRGISFAHLKGVLTTFVKRMFGEQVPVRFRPSYFPFVEPGGELDVGCTICRPYDEPGSDAQRARTATCRVCKSTGWLEVLGCGMIHPVVFEHCGWDPKEVTGFAFGMGIDRIAMLRHNVGDIRLLYENDIRFLSQL
ncbi:phenylalanine--tRNA ligase subunit alpha [Sandaracinus amylolyticus]|uniref:phenylalanine--tRNA ligase subunit alpha n=1 Tax=Sandaracinus amylolyticus TaxID=927083 RepID=UPI001F021A6E|nr:phenylalanine--tRNA ligase subunit alpha [Sandaracinus amylolyticus]UJR79960.1 Phenylalanine--tRNA ligase alpha subunit [Sandaracinus amylolyticus]